MYLIEKWNVLLKVLSFFEIFVFQRGATPLCFAIIFFSRLFLSEEMKVLIKINNNYSSCSKNHLLCLPFVEGRHIVLVLFILLILLLSEACPGHNFFVF